MKEKIPCTYLQGNGANWYKCSKKGTNCPFQRWCNKKRVFELQPTIRQCPDLKED
nr:MAG TPA: hypothetical protein [Bacteriophage sp.]